MGIRSKVTGYLTYEVEDAEDSTSCLWRWLLVQGLAPTGEKTAFYYAQKAGLYSHAQFCATAKFVTCLFLRSAKHIDHRCQRRRSWPGWQPVKMEKPLGPLIREPDGHVDMYSSSKSTTWPPNKLLHPHLLHLVRKWPLWARRALYVYLRHGAAGLPPKSLLLTLWLKIAEKRWHTAGQSCSEFSRANQARCSKSRQI